MMKVFTTIPFFRIIIPFIAGILLGIQYIMPFVQMQYFALLFVFIFSLNFFVGASATIKLCTVLLADIFFFLYGMNLASLTDKSRADSYYENVTSINAPVYFTGIINELPRIKERSVRCSFQVLSIKTNSLYKPCSGNLIVYCRKSIRAARLHPGDVLLVKAKLNEVSSPKNPYEFDYKTYLANKQVYHTSFIDSAAFTLVQSDANLNPIWLLGLRCKAFLLGQLKNSDLGQHAYGICAALLTGYDDEIDKSVMEAFSHSGTLHVLSVSGLHTGLIYLVLSFIFDLIDKRGRYRLIKFIFITVILWLFALVTGFSSPVLRAVLMFNLLGIGKLYYRNGISNQLNILLVSAFILLVYNPYFITDVGFQLSYFALAGLICFQPGILAIWQPSHAFTNAAWQSIAASCAATLSTLPLTLFYFKQFPLWFFICNMVVVPATFIILLLSILVVLHIKIAAIAINYLISFLIGFIRFLIQVPTDL